MKFKKKYDKYLTRIHKVEMQLKRTYSKYYGQVDKGMKGSLIEDPEFAKAVKEHQLQLQKGQGANQNSVTSRQGLC